MKLEKKQRRSRRQVIDTFMEDHWLFILWILTIAITALLVLAIVYLRQGC